MKRRERGAHSRRKFVNLPGALFCPQSGKVCYIDTTAERMIKDVKEIKRKYYCSFCNFWHVTSQEIYQ